MAALVSRRLRAPALALLAVLLAGGCSITETLNDATRIDYKGASKGPPPPRDEDGDAAAAPWRIVSVKPQDVAHELPMSPATIMRNALGKEHGGSGVAIDRDAYLTSVTYWGAHATIKP